MSSGTRTYIPALPASYAAAWRQAYLEQCRATSPLLGAGGGVLEPMAADAGVDRRRLAYGHVWHWWVLTPEQRLDWATRQLLACHGPSKVVADLAHREGISRRQSRRIVGAAYQQLQLDLTEAGISRTEMAAQLAHGLLEGVAIALEQKHPSAAAGCAAQLQNLLGLGVAAQQRAQP